MTAKSTYMIQKLLLDVQQSNADAAYRVQPKDDIRAPIRFYAPMISIEKGKLLIYQDLATAIHLDEPKKFAEAESAITEFFVAYSNFAENVNQEEIANQRESKSLGKKRSKLLSDLSNQFVAAYRLVGGCRAIDEKALDQIISKKEKLLSCLTTVGLALYFMGAVIGIVGTLAGIKVGTSD